MREVAMLEAGVVFTNAQPLFWHLPRGRSAASLPDDRGLWEVFWEHRGTLVGFAHSHPGGGRPSPSHIDLTTFAALEAALGRRLVWPIVTSDAVAVFEWAGPDALAYAARTLERPFEPSWLNELRRVSY